MSDILQYHTVEELRALSLDELRGLWELVPTDRQRSYRAAYDREVKSAGAEGSDPKERKIAVALLKRYHEAALVPMGMRWARTPKRVQEAAQSRGMVDASETEAAAKTGKPSGKVFAIMGVLMLVMVALMLLRGKAAQMCQTTPISRTATLADDVTPTPLALEAQDEVIEGGDASRAPFYPINLQATLPDGDAPRVWVVQRRAIRASEWNFDDNPDTASYLNGMSVRPVIGVPWSEENAAWFEQIGAGAEFRVQMNTGAILTFAFEDKREVRRSDTGIFRQVSPGLVLLLLGETDADGFPTATRTLVTATYPIEQELARRGEFIGVLAQPSHCGDTDTAADCHAHTDTVHRSGCANRPRDLTEGQVTTRLRMYNGGESPFRSRRMMSGWRWATPKTRPVRARPLKGLYRCDLLPGQAADITLIWPWHGEPYGSLGRWLVAVRTAILIRISAKTVQ